MDKALVIKSLTSGNAGEHGDSAKNSHYVSPVVRARQSSDGDVGGVNRFKYHNAGRIALPSRSGLVSAPLKATTPVLEEWVDKKQLDQTVSNRSGSSGYQSSARCCSRIQAITDRLYGTANGGSSCSRCSIDHHIACGSLPDIDRKHARTSAQCSTVSKNRRRSVSPSKKEISSSVILVNIDKGGDAIEEIREKLAWRGEKLRREIETKLRSVRLRHERAACILRDQQNGGNLIRSSAHSSADRSSVSRSMAPGTAFVRRNRNNFLAHSANDAVQQQSTAAPEDSQPSPNTQQPCDSKPHRCNQQGPGSRYQQSTLDVGLVDSPLVQNDIIKPVVDSVLRESVDLVSMFRANEALGLSKASDAYDDAAQFLYNKVIPSAVDAVALTYSSKQ